MQTVGRSILSPRQAQMSRLRWFVGIVGAAAAGWLQSCKPEPAEYVTPDVCLHQIQMRELFAQAAESAASLGRFDPYAYAISPEDKLSPRVEELVSVRSDAAAHFRDALAKIDGDS